MEKNYLSREKWEELTAELEELKTTRRKEVAGRLEFAKSLGDLSENAEYHAAREEQSDIEDRIAELEVLLKNSEIISAHHGSTVAVGSVVVVRRDGDKADQSYVLVGSEEADVASGKISYRSPIGAALLGKKKGETVTVATPRGRVAYTIVGVK